MQMAFFEQERPEIMGEKPEGWAEKITRLGLIRFDWGWELCRELRKFTRKIIT
jgi:hypothetical protein